MGLLMSIGIVVTNAIVLIDLINQYRRRGQDLRSAIIDGARLRLRPIIATACATIFALFPRSSRTDRRRGLHLRAAGDCCDWRSSLFDGVHAYFSCQCSTRLERRSERRGCPRASGSAGAAEAEILRDAPNSAAA